MFVVAAVAKSIFFGLDLMPETELRASGPSSPVMPTWPKFTIAYETKDAAIAVGDDPAVATKEIRRLEYNSATPSKCWGSPRAWVA